jgi:hypothetical protein
MLERVFGVPFITRNWNTITAVTKVLDTERLDDRRVGRFERER